MVIIGPMLEGLGSTNGQTTHNCISLAKGSVGGVGTKYWLERHNQEHCTIVQDWTKNKSLWKWNAFVWLNLRCFWPNLDFYLDVNNWNVLKLFTEKSEILSCPTWHWTIVQCLNNLNNNNKQKGKVPWDSWWRQYSFAQAHFQRWHLCSSLKSSHSSTKKFWPKVLQQRK